MIAHVTKAALRFLERGGDPTNEQLAVAPPPNVTHEVTDEPFGFSMAFVLRSVG